VIVFWLAALKVNTLFEKIDWDNIHSTVAPFVPNPDDDTDTSYFIGTCIDSDNSGTAALSLMKFCTNMYLDNLQNPIEFEGHRLRVKIIFFVSKPKFTKLFSPNIKKL